MEVVKPPMLEVLDEYTFELPDALMLYPVVFDAIFDPFFSNGLAVSG